MSESKTVLIRDLLMEIDAAVGRMSKTNPHRIVMLQAGAAIIELAQRASGVEHPQYLGTPDPEVVQ